MEYLKSIYKYTINLIGRKEEEQFNDDLGNHRVEGPSSLSIKAKERYEHFLRIFIDKKLISEPELVRRCAVKYPRLMAYNYLNDPELYVIDSGSRVLKQEWLAENQ